MADMAIIVSALVFMATLLLLFGGYYYLKYRREHTVLVEKVKTGGKPARVENIAPDPSETSHDTYLFVIDVPSLALPVNNL